MPCALPTGSWMPSGNGFDSVLDERQAVVERRHHVRVRAEAALDDVAAPLAEESVEHAVAAAQHGLVVSL